MKRSGCLTPTATGVRPTPVPSRTPDVTCGAHWYMGAWPSSSNSGDARAAPAHLESNSMLLDAGLPPHTSMKNATMVRTRNSEPTCSAFR